MLRRAGIIAAALVLPLVMPAQGVRSGRSNALPTEDREFERPQQPDAKELEKGTPAAVLLDKKKKLSLSDSQVIAITALRKATADSNALEYAAWDSVRSEMLIAGRSPTADPTQQMARRRAVMALWRNLRMRNEWARAESSKLLSEEQRAKASEYWDDQDKEDQKWQQQRSGSGGGASRGGGRRPPGA